MRESAELSNRKLGGGRRKKRGARGQREGKGVERRNTRGAGEKGEKDGKMIGEMVGGRRKKGERCGRGENQTFQSFWQCPFLVCILGDRGFQSAKPTPCNHLNLVLIFRHVDKPTNQTGSPQVILRHLKIEAGEEGGR